MNFKLFDQKDNYNKIKFGTIPSKLSDEDKELKNVITITNIFPTEYKTEFPELIFNQKKSCLCTACSLSLIRHIQIYKKTGQDVLPDPIFIYGMRSSKMYKGDEMVPKEALEILATIGTPLIFNRDDREKIMSTLCNYNFEQAQYKYKEFNDYDSNDKIYGYYRLTTTDEFKLAIMNFGAITATFRDNYSLYIPKIVANSRAYIDYSMGMNLKSEGYHQMTITGWRNKNWIVQNSWGKYYGLNGIVYIPMDYPIIEAWACVDKIDSNTFGII